jgi:hypothetical protein
LTPGTATYDIQEFGGFFTTKYSILKQFGIFGGVGYATTPSTTVNLNTLIGNFKVAGGFEIELAQNLKAYTEFTFNSSKYFNNDPISGQGNNTYNAYNVETGVLYTF